MEPSLETAFVVSYGGSPIIRSDVARPFRNCTLGLMPKQKPSAQIHVADGAGGMRPVVDLRFDDGQWPIELVVPANDAETWMAHLSAELEERDWSSSGLSQLDGPENSGTLYILRVVCHLRD
jgi:hypothetical protein